MKIVIPDDGSVEFKQTFGEHHYTNYAKPEQLLAYVDPLQFRCWPGLETRVMASSIILLDLPSGNVITDFANERDTWDALLSWARDDGLDALAGLSLMRIQDGTPTRIAMEGELVRRVAGELGNGEDRAPENRSTTAGRVAP